MMKDIGKMMKQAQQMQKNMKTLQAELDKVEMTGEAGGGLVQISMTGKVDVTKVVISPDVMDDRETLEDLMVVAFNDVHSKIQSHVQEEMNKMTGGMPMGGMFG
jgi:DNA-binding YbaB/EbfC family protein